MTEQEFKAQYCKASNITEEVFDEHFVVLPCACRDESCEGWACVSSNDISIKAHVDLYGGEEEPTAK